MEVGKFTAAEKSASSSQQCQVHVDRVFRHPRQCLQGICTPSKTVNGKFYCEVLKRLREGIRRKSPKKWKNNNWFLHHDKAPAHTSPLVQQFLTSEDIIVIPPPIRMTSPLPLFPVPQDEIRLKGRRFDTTEEIRAESQEVIDTLSFENFQGCIKSWETHRDGCKHAQGDYFEKDGGN